MKSLRQQPTWGSAVRDFFWSGLCLLAIGCSQANSEPPDDSLFRVDLRSMGDLAAATDLGQPPRDQGTVQPGSPLVLTQMPDWFVAALRGRKGWVRLLFGVVTPRTILVACQPMFAGHLGAGLALKGRSRSAGLGTLCLATLGLWCSGCWFWAGWSRFTPRPIIERRLT